MWPPSRIRNSLNHKTAATIATSLVHSLLDYTNSLYYSLPASQLYRLQLIQNTLARAISRTPLHSPISPVLHSLHWLTIEQRIEYKIYITHNLLYSSTPFYLYRLLNIQPTRPTRSANCLWPILNSLLDSNSLIDLFVMLHLLFGTNYLSPFVPSLQKQLMPTQCLSVPFPTLALFHQQFLKHLKTHLITLSFPPYALSIPSALYLFDQSLPIPCNFIECPRIHQRLLVLRAL